MRYHENAWSFETANYRVELNAIPEDDLDLSWDDTHEVREGLETGHYVAFIAETRVIFKPTGFVLGTDYLGQCIYESIEDFRQTPGYFGDMIREAIKAARANMKALGGYRITGAQTTEPPLFDLNGNSVGRAYWK